MDLPTDPEPPAVVDLLVHGYRVSDDGFPATLLDLAARGWLRLETSNGGTVCRVLRTDDGELSELEGFVLARVRSRAVDGSVPLAALPQGDLEQAHGWAEDFADHVVRHSRALGLTRRRWPWTFVVLAVLVGLAAWGFVAAMSLWDGVSLHPAGHGVLVAAGVAAFWVAGRLATARRERPTGAGRAATSRWSNARSAWAGGPVAEQPAVAVHTWGRRLAYAVALGLSPAASAEASMGADDPHVAWRPTAAGWRTRRVRYPRLRPGWGRHPLSALARGGSAVALAFVAVWLVGTLADAPQDLPIEVSTSVSRVAARWTSTVSFLGSIVATGGTVLAAMGLIDLIAARTVEGTVVRRRERSLLPDRRWIHRWWDTWTGQDSTMSPQEPGLRRYLAVDTDGDGPIRAWNVDPRWFSVASEDEPVRVRVTPLLGYVRSVTPITQPDPNLPDRIE